MHTLFVLGIGWLLGAASVVALWLYRSKIAQKVSQIEQGAMKKN